MSCTQPDDGDEKVANNDDTTLYKYGITDVLEKKEALQKGDKVCTTYYIIPYSKDAKPS